MLEAEEAVVGDHRRAGRRAGRPGLVQFQLEQRHLGQVDAARRFEAHLLAHVVRPVAQRGAPGHAQAGRGLGQRGRQHDAGAPLRRTGRARDAVNRAAGGRALEVERVRDYALLVARGHREQLALQRMGRPREAVVEGDRGQDAVVCREREAQRLVAELDVGAIDAATRRARIQRQPGRRQGRRGGVGRHRVQRQQGRERKAFDGHGNSGAVEAMGAIVARESRRRASVCGPLFEQKKAAHRERPPCNRGVAPARAARRISARRSA